MNLSQFFQDGTGSFSSTRLGFLLWVVGTLFVWGVCSFRTGSLVEIPQSVELIIGILMTGKVAQKFSETPPSK